MTICKKYFPQLLAVRSAAILLLSAFLLLLIPLPSGLQPAAMLLSGLSSLPVVAENAPNYSLVAHAMGQIDDYTGTNSLEAFRSNYEKGYRVFECDLSVTNDGQVVLRHDWEAGMQAGIDPQHIPDEDTFLETPIYGQYTPLSFDDLLDLMAAHPDILIITDTKDTNAVAITDTFSAMLHEAARLGKTDLLGRMIVQIYSPEMQDVVEKVHHFDRYMLTLYQTDFYGEEDLFTRYVSICQQRGIQDLVMWHFLYTPNLQAIADQGEVRIWLHTVNDAAKANSLQSQGAWGIYSDRIDPAEIRRSKHGTV